GATQPLDHLVRSCPIVVDPFVGKRWFRQCHRGADGGAVEEDDTSHGRAPNRMEIRQRRAAPGAPASCKKYAAQQLFGGDAHRLSRRAEMAHRSPDAGARLKGYSDVPHRKFDAAERLQHHDLIQRAEMPDAEDLAGKLAEACAEREIITMIGRPD